MKIQHILFSLFLTLGISTTSWAQLVSMRQMRADFDFLTQQKAQIISPKAEKIFALILANPKMVFDKFELQLDSGFEVTSPLQVGGTQAHPTLKLSIKKCVVFLCQTGDLDAEISVTQLAVPSKQCPTGYTMMIDLRRSSAELSDNYDYMQVDFCTTKTTAGLDIQITAQAHHAPSYASGAIQNEILKFFKLQIPALIKAFNEAVKENQ